MSKRSIDKSDNPIEYRMHIKPFRARYITRMMARLQLQNPVNFINLCIDFFWTHHPAGSTHHLLIDADKKTYVVVEHADNGIPKLCETGFYTEDFLTLLGTLRLRYPGLSFGGENVLKRAE